MTVALFVPCYIDQFYPRVAWAALTLLERLGCRVEVPPDQTCCGQPLANAGFAREARPVMAHSPRVTVIPNLPGETHLILAVEDNGTPGLTAYRRVILEVE